MDRKLILGLATALGISITANGIILLDSGETKPVQIVSGAAELTGPGKSWLAAKMVSENAPELTCKRGMISNYPDRVYCYDGGTVGILLAVATAAQLVAETQVKLPGVVAEELKLQLDKGSLYVSVEGVME